METRKLALGGDPFPESERGSDCWNETMPSTSNRLRKAIRFLVRLSEAFDRAFLPAEFAVDGNKDFIRGLYRSYLFPGATVVEVGGGKNPLITAGEKRELSLRVIGLDISARELGAAPAGVYDGTICADITQYSGSARADIAICATLLEHVRDTDAALRAIATLLKPEGVALVFVPCRNAIYARINRIAPESLKRWLLKAIYGDFPEVEAELTGFPAYYDRCTPRDICTMAQANGFTVQRLQVYFASGYFQFFPPLYVAWRFWQIAFKTIAGDQAAETFSVVLKKSVKAEKSRTLGIDQSPGMVKLD
jgi:2-polyprenyl-3-methyl-5-hydroxy-6-metoxy-1,4-benzoquinol methylase